MVHAGIPAMSHLPSYKNPISHFSHLNSYTHPLCIFRYKSTTWLRTSGCHHTKVTLRPRERRRPPLAFFRVPSRSGHLQQDKTMPTPSSPLPVPLTTRDSTSQVGALVQQSRKCRRLVKVDGEVIWVFERHREEARSNPANPMTSKYEVQLQEAVKYQVAAGDGGAPHLRAYGSRSAQMCASGRNGHVIRSRRIPREQLEPKVIQRPTKEATSHPCTSEREAKDVMSLPTPPPTPRTSRLPTPELPILEQKQFCICAGCSRSGCPKSDR